MPKSHTFLGFAFAVADLLVEVAPDGRIAFALGAGEVVTGLPDQALTGRPMMSLFQAEDHATVKALFQGLDGGTRAGPIVVALEGKKGREARFASLTAIRLPQNNGAISCTMSRACERGPTGVQPRDSFETRLAELLAGSSQELELAFVELAGLSDVESVDPAALSNLVAGVLRAQAYRGEAPTEVGPDRFALVRGRNEPTEAMAERIGRVLDASGLEGVTTDAAAVPLTGVTRPKQVMQALRYALNQVMKDGLSKPLPGDLSAALEAAMRDTLNNAGQLGAAIKHKRFRLAYQPVVTLKDGSLHHHEVLVRFGAEGSPFPTIRMAEELDLICALDEAILEEALAVVLRDPALVVAVNISGRSLVSEGFAERCIKRVTSLPRAKGRVMFELTESAAVDDLALAERHLQAMRAAGCRVCLDDFGAGAASLAYLQQLTLDLVKIDGRYIRDLAHGGREAMFIKHLVNMCAELKVQTVAEMVETAEVEDAVRKAGVDFGQGWLYGKPTETPAEAASFTARGRYREGALAIRSALDRAEN